MPTFQCLLVNEKNQLSLAAVRLVHNVMNIKVPDTVRLKWDHWSFVEFIQGYVDGQAVKDNCPSHRGGI